MKIKRGIIEGFLPIGEISIGKRTITLGISQFCIVGGTTNKDGEESVTLKPMDVHSLEGNKMEKIWKESDSRVSDYEQVEEKRKTLRKYVDRVVGDKDFCLVSFCDYFEGFIYSRFCSMPVDLVKHFIINGKRNRVQTLKRESCMADGYDLALRTRVMTSTLRRSGKVKPAVTRKKRVSAGANMN